MVNDDNREEKEQEHMKNPNKIMVTFIFIILAAVSLWGIP
jgi:hypothetical protein